MVHTGDINALGKANPVQACYRPRRLQEVEAPRFRGSRHMNVPLPVRKYSWCSFLSRPQGHSAAWWIMSVSFKRVKTPKYLRIITKIMIPPEMNKHRYVMEQSQLMTLSESSEHCPNFYTLCHKFPLFN